MPYDEAIFGPTTLYGRFRASINYGRERVLATR